MPLSQSRHSRNDRCKKKNRRFTMFSFSLSLSLSLSGKNHNPPLDMWFRQTRIRFTKFSLHCQFAMSFSVNGKYKIDTFNISPRRTPVVQCIALLQFVLKDKVSYQHSAIYIILCTFLTHS